MQDVLREKNMSNKWKQKEEIKGSVFEITYCIPFYIARSFTVQNIRNMSLRGNLCMLIILIGN
jgi:hypothetical protein